MLIKFDDIIEVVLEHEGGYVHDPKDLGGETNFGIAKRFYPDVDIKNLTKEQAKQIYKKDYWDKNLVNWTNQYINLTRKNEENFRTNFFTKFLYLFLQFSHNSMLSFISNNLKFNSLFKYFG